MKPEGRGGCAPTGCWRLAHSWSGTLLCPGRSARCGAGSTGCAGAGVHRNAIGEETLCNCSNLEGATVISLQMATGVGMGDEGLSAGSGRGCLLGDASGPVTRAGGRTRSPSQLQTELRRFPYIDNDFTAEGDGAAPAAMRPRGPQQPGCALALHPAWLWPPLGAERLCLLLCVRGCRCPHPLRGGSPGAGMDPADSHGGGSSAALQEGAVPALSCLVLPGGDTPPAPRCVHRLPVPGLAPSSPSPSASLAGA